MQNLYQWVLHSQFPLVQILLHSNSTSTNFIPIALKFVLVGDPLYFLFQIQMFFSFAHLQSRLVLANITSAHQSPDDLGEALHTLNSSGSNPITGSIHSFDGVIPGFGFLHSGCDLSHNLLLLNHGHLQFTAQISSLHHLN